MALFVAGFVAAQYSPAFLWSEKLDVGLGREAQHLHELGSADLLLTVFISGFCCLFSLQTPRKFDDPSKAA